MKVKNIVFSGFMAMVLAGACGAANAEIIVASQKYVDDKVTTLNSIDTELSGKIADLEAANAAGGSVATAIAGAQTAADNAQSDVDDLAGKMNLDNPASDLSTALAAKEDNANKITTTNTTYFTNGKVVDGALTTMASDNTNYPTVAAAVQIADAKASEVLKKVDSNAGAVAEIASTVETLAADANTAGSVAYQVKQEQERAMAAEAQALTDANAYTDSRIGDLGNRPGTNDPYANVKDYVDTVLDGVESTVGSANEALEAITKNGGIIDTKVSALENKLMNETDGTVTAAVKAEADRAKAAEQANADAITALTNGAVKDNTDAIAEINDEQNGILAQAKAYTNTEMTKFYANASECVTNSDSKNCIMSAKLDAANNVQYVWISLTSPAE